jgi:hypothetical protein
MQQILNLSLSSGSHADFEEGMCVMEAAAYIAGEPWSEQPKCACPVITSFMIAWNDALPSDAERDRLLKPLIESVIDTKSTQAVEERRSYLALDWLIRVHTPKWLDLVPSLAPHAKALRDLEEIADMAGATTAGKKVDAARDAARAAARAAARDAAGAAAWAAAGDAGWAAGWAAAGDAAGAAAKDAARDAARDARWAAAGDAAGAAAGTAGWAAAGAAAGAAGWAAAGDAGWAAGWAAAGAAAGTAGWAAAGAAAGAFLKPTTLWLQASALDLVKRMIEVR